MASQNIGIIGANKKPTDYILEADKEIAAKKKRKPNAVAPVIAPSVQKPILTPELPKKIGMTEEQKAAEAEFRQVDSGGLMGAVDTTVQPAVQPTEQVAKPIGPSAEDIQKSLADATTQRKLNALRAALERSRGVEEQRLSELPGEFRTKQSRVRTDDVMNRTAAEKISAIGATGRGSLAQTGIAQNVITQGAIGALNQQEMKQKQDIKNRISDLERSFSEGVADVKLEAETQQLQRQLDAITAKETAALKAAEIQDERDYQLFLRQLDNFDEREKAIFENELETENALLDRQIKIEIANNNAANARRLEGQRTANDIKLEGIKQTNRIELEEAKGVADADQIGGFSTSAITSSINNFMNRKESDAGAEINQEIARINQEIASTDPADFEKIRALESQSSALKNQGSNLTGDQQKQSAMLWIIDNPDAFEDETQLREVMSRYGISDQEIIDRENQIKQVSPSVGF